MNLEYFFGGTTVVSSIFNVYQYYKSELNDKDSKNKFSEFEENFATSEIIINHAINFYNEINYDKSFKAFAKYVKECGPNEEFQAAVQKIFWNESRKIYGIHYAASGTNTSTLAITIINKKDVNKEYPDFLVKLLELSPPESNNNIGVFKALVFLNKKKYELVKSNINYLYTNSDSKESIDAFRLCVELHCDYELQKSKK